MPRLMFTTDLKFVILKMFKHENISKSKNTFVQKWPRYGQGLIPIIFQVFRSYFCTRFRTQPTAPLPLM